MNNLLRLTLLIWGPGAGVVYWILTKDILGTVAIILTLAAVQVLVVFRRMKHDPLLRLTSWTAGLSAAAYFLGFEVSALLCSTVSSTAVLAPVISFFGPVAVWETIRASSLRKSLGNH
jgi:hypothetical protein